jgi:hypothetical protein
VSDQRDFAAEMRAVIDAETSHGPYVSRQAAADIVEKLKANDLELLNGWLHAQAEMLIWQAINDRDRSVRSASRSALSRSAFARASEANDAGDSGPLTHFLDAPYVVENGSRVRLADLTKADLLYVADRYDDRAKANAFEAAFMRAVAKKVRTGTVRDHFTEEALLKLRRSLD